MCEINGYFIVFSFTLKSAVMTNFMVMSRLVTSSILGQE